jgi:hypothetical protein
LTPSAEVLAVIGENGVATLAQSRARATHNGFAVQRPGRPPTHVNAAFPDERSERNRFYQPMRMADSPGVVNNQSRAKVNSIVSVSKSIDDQLGSGGEGVGP